MLFGTYERVLLPLIGAEEYPSSERYAIVLQQVGYIVTKHHDEITNAEVTLKVVKPETAMNKEASIKLLIPRNEDLFANKVADTFEEAIDLSVDALKRQLEKTKKDK